MAGGGGGYGTGTSNRRRWTAQQDPAAVTACQGSEAHYS